MPNPPLVRPGACLVSLRVLASALMLLCLAAFPVCAQWVMEASHTTASLRGIDYARSGVAWASGAGGTILRTINDGETWQRCAIPPHAEHLDFRGVQAFDANRALVMSSGPGDQSRVYKTQDGGVTWKLVFTNPDTPNGFFDALQFLPGEERDKRGVGYLIGDPVEGKFATFRTDDYGETWKRDEGSGVALALPGEALFAASNSALLAVRGGMLFVTGGTRSRSRTLEKRIQSDVHSTAEYVGGDLPMPQGESAGAFAVAVHLGSKGIFRLEAAQLTVFAVHPDDVLVAVGGNYQQPEAASGTCAVSRDGGFHWSAAETPPHGYRSAVAYDPERNVWIVVGPNGTDISTDDGRHWRSLKPSGKEPADADQHWNALSLPFAVGEKGRIGKLRSDVLRQ